jgi:hypothetical protein
MDKSQESLEEREACRSIHKNEKERYELTDTETNRQIGVQSDAKDGVAQAGRPRRLAKINSIGSITGLLGGAAVSLFGSILTGASWLVANVSTRQLLSTIGSVLLFLTIPLIVISACCLDWMEKDKPGIGLKIERRGYEEDDDH